MKVFQWFSPVVQCFSGFSGSYPWKQGKYLRLFKPPANSSLLRDSQLRLTVVKIKKLQFAIKNPLFAINKFKICTEIHFLFAEKTVDTHKKFAIKTISARFDIKMEINLGKSKSC